MPSKQSLEGQEVPDKGPDSQECPMGCNKKLSWTGNVSKYIKNGASS